ncbi:MAG TPA: carboxypeptidase regulatory-like domain-containing protein, partial [Bryobacteraceae bacterium]
MAHRPGRYHSSGSVLSVVSLMSLLSQQPLFSQQGTASIVGLVRDPSGAAVPHARVTARNAQTGLSRTVETPDSGEYTLPALDSGDYSVSAAASGFKSVVQDGVSIQYQQTRRVDIVLPLGNISDQVSVSATSAQLQTEDATPSTVIDQKKVGDLPLNGRNFIQLAQLVPGTTPGAPGDGNTSFAGTGYTVSAAGQRDFNNEYTLDGISMTETRNPAPAFLPSVDAIQEFNVQTGLFSAEYGYKAGAHVDISIKSGTNQYHGSLFEFFRNSVFDARNFFATSVSPLRMNQFGGTFGGRIKKDRTFFFLAYDGTRQRRSVT